jgi:hypothetical protein
MDAAKMRLRNARKQNHSVAPTVISKKRRQKAKEKNNITNVALNGHSRNA